MSQTLINLNHVRKSRARAERKARADENAVRFGRSKAQKEIERAAAAKSAQHLSNHQRDE